MSEPLTEQDIKRFRVGDILFNDEQAKMFCDLALKGLRAEAMTPSATAAMTPEELRHLIDFHDNASAGAEAQDYFDASLYHSQRSAKFSAMLAEIEQRSADTLAKMVAK